MGTLNPLAAKVRSAPNLLEPVELLEAKQAIRYSEGSFASKIWKRWHGTASPQEVRVTGAHFPLYRVRGG
eukprot:SAG31_NODE_35774_length_320_cov_0.683258_1_plen_69_part_10